MDDSSWTWLEVRATAGWASMLASALMRIGIGFELVERADGLCSWLVQEPIDYSHFSSSVWIFANSSRDMTSRWVT